MIQVISLIEEFIEYAQRSTHHVSVHRSLHNFSRDFEKEDFVGKDGPCGMRARGVVGNAMHEMTSELKM